MPGQGGSRKYNPLGPQSTHFGTHRSATGHLPLGDIVTTKRVEGNDLKKKKKIFLLEKKFVLLMARYSLTGVHGQDLTKALHSASAIAFTLGAVVAPDTCFYDE